MKPLAIIPARGGSKRIPRKNIKLFLGKPIIAYSIEAAIKSDLFGNVMVSTDDQEIADIAKSFGASVPFLRSKENANDFASTVDVLKEVLTNYKKDEKSFECACCIYPTAPFITATLLKESYDKLIKENLDSVFPALQYSYPIQRALKLNRNNKMEMFYPEYLNTRSQDIEPAFHDSGQFYWFKTLALEAKGKLWTNNTGIVIVPEMECQDIDTMEDWMIAEYKWKLLNAKIEHNE